MAKIAFLGTGTMGFPMARNLARSGLEVAVWNRSIDRARPLEEDGARIAADPADAARRAEVVVTMLSDADAVLKVAARALGDPGAHAVWLQCSTIGLKGTERCARLAEEAGLVFVDAPVLGTREPAEQGKLVILASGPEEGLRRCRPLFDAVGQRTIELGDAGNGTRCKVVVNSWIVGVVGVLAETVALAQSLGIDPGRFFEAVEGGPLDLPYARMKGALMVERSFDDPAFKLSLSRKDAELVLAAAAEQALELPIMEATSERLRRAEADGHAEEDMAATYWATAPRLGSRSGG